MADSPRSRAPARKSAQPADAFPVPAAPADFADLLTLRHLVRDLLLVLHRWWPTPADLPGPWAPIVAALHQALGASPFVQVLQGLQPGDLVVMGHPPLEAQPLFELFARVQQALPPGVHLVGDTYGLRLECHARPSESDAVLVRTFTTPSGDDQDRLHRILREVFGPKPAILIVHQHQHDVRMLNEAGMKAAGWVRAPGAPRTIEEEGPPHE